MSGLFKELAHDEFATMLASILTQCTITVALGLLASRLLKRNAALRRTVLSVSMACALACPFVTSGLYLADVTLVSLPVPSWQPAAPEARVATPYVDEPIVGPASPVVDSSSPHALRMDDSRDIARAITASAPRRQFDSMSLTALIWMLGFLASSYGIARSWWKVRILLRRSTPLSNELLGTAIAETRAAMSIHWFPDVFGSSAIRSPLVAGVWRPRVLLPSGLCEQLSSRELRMILMHEAAHVIRHDNVELLVERLFTAIYWFHPLAYVLVHELDRAREEVCDNYVLSCVDRPSYGETLLRVTNLLPQMSATAGAAGLFSMRWKLEERISDLLDVRRKTMVRTNGLTKLVIVVAMSAAVALIAGARLAAQQATSNPGSATAAQRSPRSSPSPGVGPTAKHAGSAVVARVNDEVITFDEFSDYVLRQHGNESLQELVHRRIIEQACREEGITITEKQIDAEIARSAARLEMGVDEWLGRLEKERDIKVQEYRRDIVWPTLALRMLAGDTDRTTYFNALRAKAKVLGWEVAADKRRAAFEVRPSETGRVAFVNVARIFKESPQFKRSSAKLKSEVSKLQEQSRKVVTEIQSLEKALRALSDERSNGLAQRELERLIVNKKAKHQRSIQAGRLAAERSEAALYHEVYRLIYAEIRSYAKAHSIELVLRDPGDHKSASVFDSIDPERTDPSDAGAVMRQINQNVLYVGGAENKDGIDITDAIIARLKSQGT